MQKLAKRLFLFVAIFGLVLCFTGCKKDNNDFVLKLSFDINKYELNLDETLKLTPIMQFTEAEENQNAQLEWVSYNEKVATVDNGTVKAVGLGTTTITVKWVEKPYVSAAVTINVVENGMPQVKFELEGFDKGFYVGDQGKLNYHFTHETNNLELEFTSLNEEVATIDQEGNIELVAKGTALFNVKAVNKNNPNKFLEYNFEYNVKELYQVTYELNGGAFDEEVVTTFRTEDETFELPVPQKEGYLFKGWFENSTFTTEQVTKVEKGSTHNYKFFAKWVEAIPGVASTFDQTKTYKFGLNHEKRGELLFMTGEYDEFYGATTQNFNDAADLNALAVEGGYNLKLTLADQSVVYLNLELSGKYKNVKFEEEPSTVWQFNTEHQTFSTELADVAYYLGTSGNATYKTFSANELEYASKNFVGRLYELVEYTDEMKVNDTLNELDIPETLVENFELPTNTSLSFALKAESAYAKINNNQIEITRPTSEVGDVKFVLVVTCKINDVTEKVEFEIVILEKSEIYASLDFGTKEETGYANEKELTIKDSASGQEFDIIAHYAQITKHDNELFKDNGMFAVLCPVRKNNNTKQSYIELSFAEAIRKISFDVTWWPNDSRNSSKIVKFELQYSTDKTTWTSIDLGSVADLDATVFTFISKEVTNAKYVRIFLEGDATYTNNQSARIIVDNIKAYK